MEKDLQARVQQLFDLHPELLEKDAVVGPLLKRDLTRLASQNERIGMLFKEMRKRLGIGDDASMEGPEGPKDEPAESDREGGK